MSQNSNNIQKGFEILENLLEFAKLSYEKKEYFKTEIALAQLSITAQIISKLFVSLCKDYLDK